MRTDKITLEEAIEMESKSEIFIYFTNQVDLGNMFNPLWSQNYQDILKKYRKVSIGDILDYLDPEYLIEVQLPFDLETKTLNWVYLYGKIQKTKQLLDQNSENGRYVYILTNPAYPNLCKIGKAVNPQKRVKQINGAGVMSEWILKYALPVVDDYLVEFLVHKHLSSSRCDNHQGSSREYFEISVKEAIEVIENLGKDFKKGEPTYY